MEGLTSYMIAKRLTDDGTPTPGEKEKWRSSTIESILTNEIYRGSAKLQKSFTADFLTKRKKKNEGEVPQYYIEFSHEAKGNFIVDDYTEGGANEIMGFDDENYSSTFNNVILEKDDTVTITLDLHLAFYKSEE